MFEYFTTQDVPKDLQINLKVGTEFKYLEHKRKNHMNQQMRKISINLYFLQFFLDRRFSKPWKNLQF